MAKSLILQSDFEMELGVGHIGRVFKAEKRGLLKQNTQIVAVKVRKDEDDEKFDELNVEEIVKGVQVMEICLDHPHIISLFDFYTSGVEYYIIMEYAIHGDLFDFLTKNSPKIENPKFPVTQNECICFAYQIAMGMEYLSSQKCVHRDLCARNILVCKDFEVKIGGFGMARYLNDSEYHSSLITEHLAMEWIAPEVVFECRHYVKSDVWSFGVLLWEIMSFGDTPYHDIPKQDFFTYLEYGHRLKQPECCSHFIYDLAETCWKWSVTERPTFAVIVERLEEHIF